MLGAFWQVTAHTIGKACADYEAMSDPIALEVTTTPSAELFNGSEERVDDKERFAQRQRMHVQES